MNNCKKIPPEKQQFLDDDTLQGNKSRKLVPVHTEETAQRGFKIFVCAGVSSIVYDLVLYTSKGMITDLSDEEKALGCLLYTSRCV